jgi:hypothetical protein
MTIQFSDDRVLDLFFQEGNTEIGKSIMWQQAGSVVPELALHPFDWKWPFVILC